jgi:hypothetical protein
LLYCGGEAAAAPLRDHALVHFAVHRGAHAVAEFVIGADFDRAGGHAVDVADSVMMSPLNGAEAGLASAIRN